MPLAVVFWLALCVPLGVTDWEAVDPWLRDWVCVAEVVSLAVCDGDCEGVDDALGVGEPLGVAPWLRVWLAVWVWLAVTAWLPL